MLLENEKKQIVKFGQKMITSKLTTGSGGNLSIFDRKTGLIAITPGGIEYFDMKIEDVVIIDINGKIIEGNKKPSSEVNFHIALYNKRSDINAVIHTHSVYATTIACLNEELPAVHYLVGFSGHKVPLAPYATFGTKQLADNVVNSIKNYNAVLLANHGLIAAAGSISKAFATAEEIELVAQIYYQARCIGKPVILPEKEMDVVIEKFKTYLN